ncbi:4-diphosphocytidyl-2-C-methyl-D-erythritol kinase, N-terminal domain-containing protein [[Mycoplasma] cavipharyngis]|uniref:GHMP family kinase ATP-binding protein n=1 Tax=[Mycoplasma] cavipharyngis TaxID=92757 RepID=UPI0037037C40
MILQAYPRITFGYKTFKYEHNYQKTLFDSIFVLNSDLFDELHLEKSDQLIVKYFDHDNQLLTVQNDLISKAALYLGMYHSINVKLKITVKKNVPQGSGLASMAACAAALIKYYADKFKLPINFRHVATVLDSNIPFFLTGFKVARVQNFGDQVSGFTNIKLPEMKLHLTNIKLDANKVHEVHKVQKRFLANNYISKLIQAVVNDQPYEVYNEYQNTIFKIAPNLFLEKAKLQTQFNSIFLSGLGSTLIEIKNPHFVDSK